jgi:hypothetical protein
MIQQCLIVGPILREIEGFAFLAFGNDQFAHALQKSEDVFRADPFLRGIDRFADLASVGVKEPLSPLARCSGVAVIPPVDRFRHE